MQSQLSPEISQRLSTEKNIWIATVRPDKRPHLVPVWFVFDQGFVYCCVAGNSVKAMNLDINPAVALSLEDGTKVVIGEGRAEKLYLPWQPSIIQAFKNKYDWDISIDEQYQILIQIMIKKWLTW